MAASCTCTTFVWPSTCSHSKSTRPTTNNWSDAIFLIDMMEASMSLYMALVKAMPPATPPTAAGVAEDEAPVSKVTGQDFDVGTAEDFRASMAYAASTKVCSMIFLSYSWPWEVTTNA